MFLSRYYVKRKVSREGISGGTIIIPFHHHHHYSTGTHDIIILGIDDCHRIIRSYIIRLFEPLTAKRRWRVFPDDLPSYPRVFVFVNGIIGIILTSLCQWSSNKRHYIIMQCQNLTHAHTRSTTVFFYDLKFTKPYTIVKSL